ncbi:MAG TPA: hypothetical protein VK675_00560 [Candidatus Paceibacterota bacterium]|nr:hypothetical protein [Candidatus Paceibacterota bacterium]
MVEKFRKILESIKKEKGEINLFALMKMDELADKWTLILSASWAKEGDTNTFKYILNSIKSVLSPEEITSIARVAIYPKTSHLIELLLKYNNGTTIVNESINGNQVHEGYIIESNVN